MKIFSGCTERCQQRAAQGQSAAQGKCGSKTVTALKATAAVVAIAAVVFGVLAALQLNGINISSGFAGFNAIGTTGAYALIAVGGGSLIAYLIASAVAKKCHDRQNKQTAI